MKKNLHRINRQRTFARILNRFSCIFLVSFSCFRTMDNLQLIIHDIAMTPKNTISMTVQDKALEALLDMNSTGL